VSSCHQASRPRWRCCLPPDQRRARLAVTGWPGPGAGARYQEVTHAWVPGLRVLLRTVAYAPVQRPPRKSPRISGSADRPETEWAESHADGGNAGSSADAGETRMQTRSRVVLIGSTSGTGRISRRRAPAIEFQQSRGRARRPTRLARTGRHVGCGFSLGG
jgi:hypothetical protein